MSKIPMTKLKVTSPSIKDLDPCSTMVVTTLPLFRLKYFMPISVPTSMDLLGPDPSWLVEHLADLELMLAFLGLGLDVVHVLIVAPRQWRNLYFVFCGV